MDNKKKVPGNTITRDVKYLAEPTGNIYESVVVLYKRANQISLAEKKELKRIEKEMKMKHLLLDAAMGMMPSKMWNGQYTSNGGYLVVKNDGDLVCYHFYNINDVQKYLYVNTKFENGGRKKHKFGNLYHNEEGQVCIKLNLQIRFTH